MDYEEFKVELIQKSASGDFDSFMNSSMEFVNGISSTQQINQTLELFCASNIVSFLENYKNDEKLNNFLALYRKKIYELFISQKVLFDYKYGYLCKLFMLGNVEPAAEISNEIKGIISFIGKSPDPDKLKFAYYIFVLMILNNEKENAFAMLVRLVLPIRYYNVPDQQMPMFLLKLLDYSSVPFEAVLEGVGTWFDEENYFALVEHQRKSIFNWCFNYLWNSKLGFNNLKWKEYYGKWKNLLYKHIENDQAQEVMWLHFFIYHVMGNSFHTQDEWKEYNDNVDKPASDYYKKYANDNMLPKCKANARTSGKQKIVILKDRLVLNSPFKVEYSFLKALTSLKEFTDKYEMIIVSVNYIEKSDDDEKCINSLKSLGIEVHCPGRQVVREGMYNSHLQKALATREFIINNDTDILVFPASGYDIFNFLITNRCAPKQIFWSHGNAVYDIPNIDKRITHCGLDDFGHDFELFKVHMDQMFHNPPVDMNAVRAERAKFPDGIVLGSIGRLMKVDNEEYIKALAEIMNKCSGSIYLACGAGSTGGITALAEKYGIADRIFFPGMINPHIYGHLIDVYLDTFPLQGGESVQEFVAKGVAPVVILAGDVEKAQRLDNLENEARELVTGAVADAGEKIILSSSDFNFFGRKSLIKKVVKIASVCDLVLVSNNKKDCEISPAIKYIDCRDDKVMDLIVDYQVSLIDNEIRLVKTGMVKRKIRKFTPEAAKVFGELQHNEFSKFYDELVDENCNLFLDRVAAFNRDEYVDVALLLLSSDKYREKFVKSMKSVFASAVFDMKEFDKLMS